MVKNIIILGLSVCWILGAVLFYYDGHADGYKAGKIAAHKQWQETAKQAPHILVDEKGFSYYVYKFDYVDEKKIADFLKKQMLGEQKDGK